MFYSITSGNTKMVDVKLMEFGSGYIIFICSLVMGSELGDHQRTKPSNMAGYQGPDQSL